MKVVVFDLDDTLVETRQWFHGFLTILGYPIPNTDSYKLEEHGIPEHVIQFALSEASFMLQGKAVNFIHSTLAHLRAAGYVVAVCTHRAYHSKGEDFTNVWLHVNHLRDIDEQDIHVIDPAKHPCKLAYLDRLYSDYVLVDDNPANLRSDQGRVILYDRPWNRHHTHHRIKDLRELPKLLETLWNY